MERKDEGSPTPVFKDGQSFVPLEHREDLREEAEHEYEARVARDAAGRRRWWPFGRRRA